MDGIGSKHVKGAAGFVAVVTFAVRIGAGVNGAFVAAFLSTIAAAFGLTVAQACVDKDRAVGRRAEARDRKRRPGRQRPF